VCVAAAGIAWVKRCPNPMPGDSEIEIRPIQEQRLPEQVAGQG
jgi:hypothetical protein